MSKAERADDIPAPRETVLLHGHAATEQALLDAYRSGRLPHALLLTGPRGIGKATLAYRFARFVLAHPDPAAAAVRAATSLALDADHPVARRIAGQAQPDFLVLERTVGDNGRLRQDIAVDDVRKSVAFFGSTAGEGGWRIALVDAVDELNPNGANALLKIVEEPPPRALVLLVCHAAGQVLPTIRSRCRLVPMRPLAADEVARAAAAALDRDAASPELQQAAAAAEGSVARALALMEGNALKLRSAVLDALDRLPAIDPLALHALGDAMAGTDAQTLAAFVDTVSGWLSERLEAVRADPARAIRLAAAWDHVATAGAAIDTYNLERKPFVFSVFGQLAEAARG